MANGRMTFRFDMEKDKSKHEPAEYKSGRGLGTARDYDVYSELQQEDGQPLQTWPADSVPVLEQIEVQENLDVHYTESLNPSRPFRDMNRENEGHRNRKNEGHRNRKNEGYREQENGGYRDRYPVEDSDDEPDEHGELSYSGGGYVGTYHTRRPSYWWKFALSVAGAVATGLLLGYAALSMIHGGAAAGGNEPDKANTAVTGVQNGSSNVQPVAPDTGLPVAGTDNAGVGKIPVDIAAQSYYLLQYGVFSTPDGAAQARQELQGAGLAAGFDPEGGNRVYAGVSPDREQAKLLSSGLKSEGIELYVRELVLPGAEQASYAGKAEAVNSYFTASNRLLSELSSVSAALLSGSGQAAGSASVSDLHMQWTEAVKALEPGLTPEGKSLCASLEKSMNRGIAALNEYDKNKAQGLLWEVQESMMGFLTGQQSLLSVLTQG